jgi:hypothetical protein
MYKDLLSSHLGTKASTGFHALGQQQPFLFFPHRSLTKYFANLQHLLDINSLLAEYNQNYYIFPLYLQNFMLKNYTLLENNISL